MSTSQDLLLFPESKDAVYRRHRLLFHHDYLARLRGGPTRPMVYALARRGAEALIEHGCLENVGNYRMENRGLGDRYAAHQAMITNFRIALALATRERPDVQLLLFKPESLALRDRVTVTKGRRSETIPVNPDGFVGLLFPNLPEGRNRTFFSLEADRSTMTRERFVQKLVGYRAWHSQGGHRQTHSTRALRVLTVTKSEEKLGSLLQAVTDAEELREGLRLFWFTAEKRSTDERPPWVVGRIWETPDRAGDRQTIVPQVSSLPRVATRS